MRTSAAGHGCARHQDRRASGCAADAVLSVRPDWVERWRSGMKQDQRTGVGSKKPRERARLLDNAAAEIASDAGSREGGRI